MKKIYLIMFTVFLNIGMFSCTPTNNIDDNSPQACCGDDIPIPPPPPTGN